MNYKRGFHRLKTIIQENNPDRMSELATLEERFLRNEHAEVLYGSSEITSSERNRVVYALNLLAWEESDFSFVDLCVKDITEEKDQGNAES